MNWKKVSEFPLPILADGRVFLVCYESPKDPSIKNYATYSCGPIESIQYEDGEAPYPATHWLEIVPPDEPQDIMSPTMDEILMLTP